MRISGGLSIKTSAKGVYLYDIAGHLLQFKKPQSGSARVDLEEISAGQYVLEYRYDKAKVYERVQAVK